MSRPGHHQEREQPQSSRETEHGDAETPRTCKECDSLDVVSSADDHELVCENCGLIIQEDQIDQGPEWRAFTHSQREDKSRVGLPTTQSMHDKGLTTTISWRDKDAYGNSLSAEKRTQMRRLRKWQERMRTNGTNERNLQFALSEMDRMASALGIPRSVREIASVIYRRALKQDLIRGRSIEAVATSSLYAACRQEGMPRSLDEMTEVSRVGRTEIGRSHRYLSKQLGLNLRPADPKQYVPRFASELDLDDEVERKAIEIIDDTAEQGLLSGKSPTGYAAAAIYAASLLCNKKRTQADIADVTQVTEVTIRDRYQEQMEALDLR